MSDCHVYRLFDSTGTLLYVGCSGDVASRLSSHRRKSWGADIDAVRVERFESRDEALAAEMAAIRGEAPVHNIVVTGGVDSALAIRLQAAGLRVRRLTALRNTLVVKAVRGGFSLREVAKLVGLSHPSVLAIVKKAKATAP